MNAWGTTNMDNRFEQLRYKDKYALDADMSINQVARLLGISPATVSKLEHDENYDARISIIKKYKEKFPDVDFTLEDNTGALFPLEI